MASVGGGSFSVRRKRGGITIRLEIFATRIKQLVDKLEYASFCAGLGCASLALGSITGLPFHQPWRVFVGTAVTLTGMTFLGQNAKKLFERVKRQESAAVLQVVEDYDSYVLHYTRILMDSERILDVIRDQLGDTDGVRDLLTVIRTIGQLEGTIESFHHVVGAGFGPQFSRALLDPINVKLQEVAAACARFEHEE